MRLDQDFANKAATEEERMEEGGEEDAVAGKAMWSSEAAEWSVRAERICVYKEDLCQGSVVKITFLFTKK